MLATAYRENQEAQWDRTAWATAWLLRPYTPRGEEPLTGDMLRGKADPAAQNAAFDALVDDNPEAVIDAVMQKQAARKPHG